MSEIGSVQILIDKRVVVAYMGVDLINLNRSKYITVRARSYSNRKAKNMALTFQ